MKIEAGKYYRLNNGEKAYVYSVIPNKFSSIYPVRGFSLTREEYVDDYLSWAKDGKNIKSQSFDIKEEWKEPKTISGTLYMYHDGEGRYYHTDYCGRYDKPLGSTEVLVVEGRFIKLGEVRE